LSGPPHALPGPAIEIGAGPIVICWVATVGLAAFVVIVTV
jgi:hypothetical protein